MASRRRQGPSVLRVEQEPAAFERLLAGLARRGARVGWLDLAAPAAVPELDAAASVGVLRAVAVGSGRSVALKRLGRPVLRDLLREHFSGFALVLVRARDETEPPLAGIERHAKLTALEPGGEREQGADEFRIEAAGRTQTLPLETMVAAVGRPSAWWWR